MVKKVLSLICSLTIVVGMIVPWTGHAEAATVTETTCACGATSVTWETLTADTTPVAGGHYKLASNVAKRFTINAEGTFCVDLAGYTLGTTGRTFVLGDSSAKGSPATKLNIMDSSANQTGVVQGTGGSGNSGGLFYIFANAECNLYSGTIKPNTQDVIAYTGGIFSVYGTLNVYGGTVIGGKLGGTSTNPHVGGTVVVQTGGAINLYGGEVRSGIAETDALGHCIYIRDGGTAKLSGSAIVGEIAFATQAAKALTVSGTYTGTAQLRLNETITSGMAVGKAENAKITGAIAVVDNDKLAVAVAGSNIVLGEGKYCSGCRATVPWQPLTKAAVNGVKKLPAGHYCLVEDISAVQMELLEQGSVCLDLAGYTYTSTSRAFVMGNAAGANKVVLNIQDSSAKQTGVLQGSSGDGTTGGVIYVYHNAELNLYSGTITPGVGASGKEGGTIATGWFGKESVNIYGGKILGCPATTAGGAINLRSGSTLNVYGGEIVGGSAPSGDCVFVAKNGIVKLSGSGSVEELYFDDSSATTLTVTGNYTGKATLKFKTAPTVGTDIGNCSDAVIGTENISIASPRLYAKVSGSNLVATALTGVSLTKKNGTVTYHTTLAEALEKSTTGSVIKLLADNSETVTIHADTTLDLFGWDLTGNITVANGTLYAMDSCTKDYTVEDVQGYGVISGTVTGNLQGCENYLKVSEAEGNSFHAYGLKLTKVSLRPGNVGMYYSGHMRMDEVILAQTERFGIAVSTNSETPTAQPGDATSLYTAYPKESYGDGQASSALIVGVMDQNQPEGVNSAYAATIVYGRPYVLLNDGTYLYGDITGTNLQQLTEAIDSSAWSKLTLPQNRALMAMYDTYRAAMTDWKLTNIASSATKKQAAADDGVLKAVVIGNSASVDAISLLAAIFQKEAPDQKFVLGCMYESGCPIADHVSFFQNDVAVYDYYKNTGANSNGAWSKYANSTLQDGLTDQNWDVVIFQELHTISGLMSTFENDNLETLIAYVVNQLGYEPQLDWHSVGIIPEIPEAYVEYVNSVEGDDGGGTDAGENEGWDGGVGNRPEDLAWIFDIACPSYPVTWAKNYIRNYNNDSQYMFDSICNVATNHIMKSETYAFDDVIPGGAVIQYAKNGCGLTDRDLFRDYAHKNDFGRLLIGYVWYASLMEIEAFTQLAYTTVPVSMRHSSSPREDLVLTPEQIQIVLDSVNYALANPFESPEPTA